MGVVHLNEGVDGGTRGGYYLKVFFLFLFFYILLSQFLSPFT